MSEGSAPTTSLWMAAEKIPPRAPLKQNLTADVCVVGAGIAGLTTAYLLAREGSSVIVLDDGPVGGGETGRTTAHLCSALDDGYFEIEKDHGKEGARLAAESHAAAVDLIESIVSSEKIDCGFERVDGYLFVPPGEPVDVLDDELAATHRAGLSGVERVDRAPLPDIDTGVALRFPRQAQFHPLKYLKGLAEAFERLGGRICNQTHAAEFEDGTPALVKTAAGHTVTARAIVVATNTPVNDWVAIHTKQAGYRTYVIGMPIERASVARALYWDTADPYHYVRLADDGGREILIVGGEDHKTGQADDTEERFGSLEAWTRQRFHTAGPVEFRWSGQVMEPIDGLAFIGRNPGNHNIYIVTGDSGNGMTHGSLAGILLTDLISGRDNLWAGLYDPGRVPLRAAAEFARENLNVAAQYAGLVTPGEVSDVSAIPPGAGAVIRRGLKKVAAYRDPAGRMHECSAVCPHLGCIVDWNATENSWDCPCHGSRFSPGGEVINGPANTGLAPAG